MNPPLISLDVKVDGALLRGAGPAVVGREMLAAMHASTQHLRGRIMPLTPVGVSGMLRAGTQVKVTTGAGTPVDIEGRVFNPLGYGMPVEDGRRPGKKPPLSPILLWVRRVIAPPEEDAKGIAFAIRYKIGKEGTKAWRQMGGRHMFEFGFNAAKATVNGFFDRARGRITAELSK